MQQVVTIVGWVGLGVGALWLALAIPWFGNRRRKHYHSPFEGEGPFAFPEGFLWGASTAAQQIESQQHSDWSAFENKAYDEHLCEQISNGVAKPGHIHHLDQMPREVVTNKTNFDEMYRDDIAQMSDQQHNAYRFSISWSRLFPTLDTTEPTNEGIAYYTALLDELERHNITPSATLFHFSSPAWLWEEKDGKRGWERDDALAHFERFVGAVIEAFGPRISHWCTLNEPMVYLYQGYLEGLFPPNEQREGGPEALTELVVRLLEAHTLAYQRLKADAASRNQPIQVGIAKHTRAFEAFRNHAFQDRLIAKFAEDAFVWDFLDAMHTGTYRMTSTSFQREIPGLKGSMDYVGINYYGRFYLRSPFYNPMNFEILPNDPHAENERTSELGWALYPHGFYQVLQRAHERYGKPIYILENGIDNRAIDDSLRQHFLVTHLREVWNAIHHAKADIKGYFYWSWMDNFEWAEGFGPRFGLQHVDYEHGYKRTPRQSAQLYSEIIKDNQLTKEQWNTWK